MKTKILILSLFLSVFSFNVKGQNSSIITNFGSQGISIPDTVAIGDTIWFSCWVVNGGEDVLAENILIKVALFDNILGLYNIRTIGGQGPNFIYPGDSIQFVPGFLFEVVTSTNYLIGDNIVVIWPKADAPNTISQTNQYIYSNLHVLSNSISSISESFADKQYFYPQPATDKLYFNSPELITSVKIFNILGKQVLSFKSPESSIAINNLAEGLYLVKIRTKKGEKKIQKLIIKR